MQKLWDLERPNLQSSKSGAYEIFHFPYPNLFQNKNGAKEVGLDHHI